MLRPRLSKPASDRGSEGNDSPRIRPLSRRQFLSMAAAGTAVAAGGALFAESRRSGASISGMNMTNMVGPHSPLVAEVDAKRWRSGRPPLKLTLAPRPYTVDFGVGPVNTWAYREALPGPELRLRPGDTISALLDNQVPAPSTIHWHGLAIRNDMDGADGMTQAAVPSGGTFLYDFVVPDAGTYFYHPHYGLQLDRGMYGPLIVEDPSDPDVDVDAVVMLDDWLDGVAGTPDEAWGRLTGIAHGTAAPDSLVPPLGSMMAGDLGGMAGDIAYPYYLINGRSPESRQTITARRGGRVRLRIINAGADTAFRFAVGGHRLTVTHTDGFPVQPVEVDSLVVGMAERYDVVIEPRSGAWPIVAVPEGKTGVAAAVLRTTDAAVAAPPPPLALPAELHGRLLNYADLRPAEQARLRARSIDRVFHVDLMGNMARYSWGIGGPDVANLNVRLGDRVRIAMRNVSDMWHPMHLHGHTYAAVDFNGIRKDTLIVPPGTTRTIEVECDNPGMWMFHCHNLYHFKSGMATSFNYVR